MGRTEVFVYVNCLLGNSTRFRLVKLLQSNKDGLSISDMAERLNTEKSVVAYHLSILEEHGFVEGEYKIVREATDNRHGLIERIYKTTNKVNQAVVDIENFLKELKAEIAEAVKHDPQEDDPKLGPIIKEAAEEARRKVSEKYGLKEGEHRMGIGHEIWIMQKIILKEKGIDWKSPREMNPHPMFD